MQKNLTLPSPAKLNLFLHILGKREDGYHDIQTIFQFIDFSDTLSFIVNNNGKINLKPEFVNIPHRENLIIRAAQLLRKHTQCQLGVNITLNKRIPIGAGLGGGSSNAATTLLALNHLWETQLTSDQLMQLGRELGADVPVFLYGHAAWAEGIGDQLTPIILPEPWYVLIIPPCQVSTKNIYQDPRLTHDKAVLTLQNYQFGQGHNDFEPIVRMDYPEVAFAIDWLSEFAKARMTGSGSVVFAGFDSEEEAGRIAQQVPANYKIVVARGCNHSPLHTAFAI